MLNRASCSSVFQGARLQCSYRGDGGVVTLVRMNLPHRLGPNLVYCLQYLGIQHTGGMQIQHARRKLVLTSCEVKHKVTL